MSQHGEVSELSPEQPSYVGFWARFLAFVVDSVWVTLIVGLLLGAVYGPEYIQTWVEPVRSPQALLMSAERSHGSASLLIELGLPALAFLLFWMYRSATPGKMIVSAVIVDADTLGKPSTGQLVGRYLGYYVSILGLCLGFLWIAWDKRKQGWHDKLAGTVVIRR